MTDKRILIVDDEEPLRELFTQAFTQVGFAPHAVASAEEALTVMEKTPYWVLFLDLNLPGMNGLDLCRKIREGWPLAICHAVTGYASLFELLDCREAGFEDYFTKPVDLPDLFAAAEQAFAKLQRWQGEGDEG